MFEIMFPLDLAFFWRQIGLTTILSSVKQTLSKLTLDNPVTLEPNRQARLTPKVILFF
jgi:hypothetical protein